MASAPLGSNPAPFGRLLFGLAICGSAFLLFLVQPLVGKRLLPWYGGVPAVWTLCLAFYQVALFAGYAYAHALIGTRNARLQLVAHLVVCALAVALLPVLPGDTWRPVGSAGVTGTILATLLATVAVPFGFLAATGPLVQAWFARAHPTRSPYFLYAVSNAGSLGALLLYPLVIEPRVGLSATGAAWGVGFCLVGACVLGCAVLAARVRGSAAAPANEGPRPGRRSAPAALLWVFLAGTAVVLLMGTTNKVCVDVASVPFLWILPLAIYLVTFVLCFSDLSPYRRGLFVPLTAVLMLLRPATEVKYATAFTQPLQGIEAAVAIYAALLFCACMVLHGELYRLRPPENDLTRYYLSLSGGGAIAGVFVGVLAPHLFDDYAELPIGLTLWWLLLAVVVLRDAGAGQDSWTGRLRVTVVASLGVGTCAATWIDYHAEAHDVLHQERSFFGVLRVTASHSESGEDELSLHHGSTVHGVQLVDSALRIHPNAYYGRATGVGLALTERAGAAPLRIAVVGLGVGTLATYGRPGDLVRFYEIDPAVVALARDSGHFTFLRDSRATLEIVEGDGRLALAAERERGEPGWDLLIMDAFNSDAPPVHLLTREAFELYAARLAPGGCLAINVSNRHLDLTVPAFRQGSEVGFTGTLVITRELKELFSYNCRWALLSFDAGGIAELTDYIERQRLGFGAAPEKLRTQAPDAVTLARARLWTDDYSDLLSVLR